MSRLPLSGWLSQGVPPGRLTQEQVAEAWGRAQRHVSRIERGDLTNVPLRSLAEYVDALGGSMCIVFELHGARIEVPCSSTGEVAVERTLTRQQLADSSTESVAGVSIVRRSRYCLPQIGTTGMQILVAGACYWDTSRRPRRVERRPSC